MAATCRSGLITYLCRIGLIAVPCDGGPSPLRFAGILVLVFALVTSTTASGPLSTQGAQSHDMRAHTMASDDLSGHDTGEHDMTAHGAAHHAADGQTCDHGTDCDCHDGLTANCCGHAASIAAIWTSVKTSGLESTSGRVRAKHAHRAVASLDPPTPPPRISHG